MLLTENPLKTYMEIGRQKKKMFDFCVFSGSGAIISKASLFVSAGTLMIIALAR